MRHPILASPAQALLTLVGLSACVPGAHPPLSASPAARVSEPRRMINSSQLPSFESCAPLVLTRPATGTESAPPLPPDPSRGDSATRAVVTRAVCSVLRAS
jgi:hypothetical protein